MSTVLVPLSKLKKGVEFKQYDTDNYTYTVVGRTKFGIRYKVTGDSAKAFYHNNSWPEIMVKMIKTK